MTTRAALLSFWTVFHHVLANRTCLSYAERIEPARVDVRKGCSERMNIRVLVVDDDLFVRQSLQKMLSRTPGISTAGFAENGTQALEMFASEAVDLVLMDVQLPDIDGVSTAAEIRALDPKARVLMFSSYCDQSILRKAIGAGASGYILKDAEPDTLISAIRAAASGLLVFSEIVLQMLFDNRPAGPSQVDELTPGEQEALHLLSLGKSNREIAEALHLSESSIKARLSSAASKLGSSSRTGTVARAKDLGIV